MEVLNIKEEKMNAKIFTGVKSTALAESGLCLNTGGALVKLVFKSNIKFILTLVILSGLFLQSGNAANKYSVATGNWNSTATWSLTSGGAPGAPVPTSSDVVIIEGGYSVTVTASTATVISITISSGSTLTTTNDFNLSAATITVNGTLVNSSTGAISGTTTVNSGGTYQHNINGGTIKTATWNSGSTCLISGVTSSSLSGTGQSFSNFTWNSVNTNAATIAPTAINGNFNVTAGGTGGVRFSTTQFTIGGNLNVSGTGNLLLSTSTTARTLNVNGNFSMAGGAFTMSSGSAIGTLNVKGNYTHSSGTISESSSGSGAIVFLGNATQTFTSGGTVSNTIKYTVNSGTTLQMADASTVVSGNAFTLSSGAGLGIKSTAGITSSGATGNIQTTTRTYSTTANYLYNGTSAQVTGNGLTTFNNLTINNPAGVTASSNLTVNGILNLQSANASSTKGALEMVTDYGTYPLNPMTSYVLTMGSAATTVGIGDVTGKVKRTTIVSGVSNTFGNEKTTITFTALTSPVGTMPTDLTVTIMIGSVLGGKPSAVKRGYEIIPTMPGGANTNSIVAANFHYIDGELNGNTESKLVTGDFDIEGGGYVREDEHGRSAYDITTPNYKFLGVSNVPASYFIQSWRTIFFIADYLDGPKTWTGITSGSWDEATNWEPNGVPSAGSKIIIPVTTTPPTFPSVETTIRSLSIESEATVTLNANLILKGGGNPGAGAFLNVVGTLNANSKKMTFQDLGGTISGTANLYDVEISTGSSLTNESGSIMRISGTVTKTGLWYADVYSNTVEYNGGAQNVVLTDGTASYYNLILSGNGTKTLPASAMTIYNNFSTSGTATAAAQGVINTTGNFEIGSGTTFTAGSYNHTVGGNFTKSGTFTSTGSTITMNGYTTQTISGSPAFNNLTINNHATTILDGNTSIAGDLTITSGSIVDLRTYTCNRSSAGGTMTIAGKLKLGGSTGGQTGSNFPLNFSVLNLAGGNIEYYGSSQTIYTGVQNTGIIISGSEIVTIPSGDITLDDFELNNASGVTLNGNLTVNHLLNLNNGILTLGDKNLTLGSTATVSGEPSGTNMVDATGTGELRKVFTGTGSFIFPVGSFSTSLDYSPVTLNFASGTFSSAYVGVNLSKQKHPNNTSASNYLNRYWTVTQSGISNFSCGIILQYLADDVAGNESDIWGAKYSGGVWTLMSVSNPDANQLSGTVTSFSVFSGGEQGVLPVTLSSINSAVNGRNVKLNWITTLETNNSGFEIQRAAVANGIPVYTKTGYVTGKGTSNTVTNYSYEDKNLQTGKYKYRLKQIDVNGNFEYFNLNGEVEVGVPGKYELSQNYPNPFNPVTKINFDLPFDSKVKIIVYDVTGREIKTLVNEIRTAGYYTIVYDASIISSGAYFYRIVANANGKDYIATKKMILIK